MKRVIFLIFFVYSTNSFAAPTAKATASDICANNFLNMMNDVSLDKTGKFKRIIFTFDTDKELLGMSHELLKLSDPVNSPEALMLFKKATPIFLKHGKKVFNLCIRYTNAMNKELAKICPNLKVYNKECTEAASIHPNVSKLMKESELAINALVIAEASYKPSLPK